MDSAPAWSSDTDDTLLCVQVRPETHDVKTFVFNTPSPRRFAYLPGQFLTLSVPIGPGGETVQRSYTISSSPTRPDRLSITVKRVPGGPMSNWLHDHLQAGMQVDALGPAGEFSCFAKGGPLQPISLGGADRPRYLFVSGGSGITPLMSMTRALSDLSTDADILFVHAARSPDDLIFADELRSLARQHPRLQLAFVCEQHGSQPHWPGYRGRLDAALLMRIAPDLRERDVYSCGPGPFMAAIRRLLAELGHPEARYREESFNFEELASASLASAEGVCSAPPVAASGHRITLNRLGDTFTCQPGQTILAAAIQAGVRLPASCSNGLCGTCKTHKVSGEVTMNHKGGIRQRDVDQGWILPCCSHPQGDVVLDR
ncbi:hybrid-cluster NAD(P)-dependent oxidoreductase [uncultured Aquabacterium sp.]|uniref:hybrid-cluster NAD(P)-dependent oxidoreductase n=1 Tax=Aquabacterium sp. TaxID=1872578 RepID=UPI0025D8F065|nr:hybrid-cluster NAD(P)-dependent oxidoreductase [uncultured Aquabacterium sp.]